MSVVSKLINRVKRFWNMSNLSIRRICTFAVIAILFIGTASLLISFRSNQYIQAGTYIDSPNLHNEIGSKIFSLTGWGAADEGDFYFFSHAPARTYQKGAYRQLKEGFVILLTDDMRCCGYAVFQGGKHITVLWCDGTYDELYKYDKYAVLP